MRVFFRMADDEFHDAVEGDDFDFEPTLERFYDFYRTINFIKLFIKILGENFILFIKT